jgi:hypothetical protein
VLRKKRNTLRYDATKSRFSISTVSLRTVAFSFVSKSLYSSTLVVRKQRNTLRYDTVEVENQLKVHGKRVETNLVTGNLTSKVINIYETKNPSTLPSMSSILIYFQTSKPNSKRG